MSLIKTTIAIALLATLVGCGDAKFTEVSPQYVLPPALTGCQVYVLEGSDARSRKLDVVYCKNATTSTTSTHGKATQTTVVVDAATDTQ